MKQNGDILKQNGDLIKLGRQSPAKWETLSTQTVQSHFDVLEVRRFQRCPIWSQIRNFFNAELFKSYRTGWELLARHVDTDVTNLGELSTPYDQFPFYRVISLICNLFDCCVVYYNSFALCRLTSSKWNRAVGPSRSEWNSLSDPIASILGEFNLRSIDHFMCTIVIVLLYSLRRCALRPCVFSPSQYESAETKGNGRPERSYRTLNNVEQERTWFDVIVWIRLATAMGPHCRSCVR
jgi:hypothetical protein